MLKGNKIFVIGGIVLFGFALATPFLAKAADNGSPGGFFSGVGCYNSGMCGVCDFVKVLSNIFHFLRDDIGFPLAVLMIIYGGILMIFSAGSSKRVESGRKVLMAAIIGFAIVLAASLILNTVLMITTKSHFTPSNIFSGAGLKCQPPL